MKQCCKVMLLLEYFIHWYYHPHAPLVGPTHTPLADIPLPPFSRLNHFSINEREKLSFDKLLELH